MNKKLLAIILSGCLMASALTGCGSKDKEAAGDGVQKITVAVGNTFPPYAYTDENDKPAGYDVEVLKAIDEKLEQYEFEYQSMDFKNILLSVESNKAQIGTQQFERNPEREEKYLYNDESFAKFTPYTVVGSNNNTIKSFEDLAGKTMILPTADNTEQSINEFNEKHPDNPIKIKWMESGSTEETLALLESSDEYATPIIPVLINLINQEYGGKLKAVGEPIIRNDSYFLLNKDQTELKEAMDKALVELREEGKLSELSMSTLGVDVTQDNGGIEVK